MGVNLNHVLGLKKARRDLLQCLQLSAEEHCIANSDEASAHISDEDQKRLRSAGVIFIAEFFYVLKALDLVKDADGLESYLLAHNAGVAGKIKKIREQKQSSTPSGLTVTRLEASIISTEKIGEMVEDARSGFFRFDQATFCMLLNELMSFEVTRYLVETLVRCGFLNVTGRRPKYISSKGTLELAYESYLFDIQNTFSSGGE